MAPELTLTGILKLRHSRPFDKEKASQQVPQFYFSLFLLGLLISLPSL